MRARLRSEAGIVVESGEPREVMHFCLLCGYGANAINPYLAFEAIHQPAREDGDLPADVELDELIDHYITAVKKGILKTMSKMGISTLRSYHAAQQFEAVGLSRDGGRPVFHAARPRGSRGVGLDVIAREALARHRGGLRPPRARRAGSGFRRRVPLPPRRRGRTSGTPQSITRLQHAVLNNDPAAYDEYARAINDQSRRAVYAPRAVRVRAGRAGAAGGGRAGQPRSSSGSTPGPCRTARSARRPTRRWPSP